jgi:hypothetical protein
MNRPKQCLIPIVLGLLLVTGCAGNSSVLPPEMAEPVAINPANPKPDTEKFDFDELNFSFRLPGKNWKKIDSDNPNAQLFLVSFVPERYLMIMADINISGETISYPHIMETMKMNMNGNFSNLSFSKISPLTVNKMDGAEITAEMTLEGHDIFYHIWIYQNNNYLYQIFQWCPKKNESFVRNDTRSVLAGFQQIIPQRSALNPEDCYTGFHSRQSGIIVQPLDLMWSAWPEVSTQIKGAVTGAHKGKLRFAIIQRQRDDMNEKETGLKMIDEFCRSLSSHFSIACSDKKIASDKTALSGIPENEFFLKNINGQKQTVFRIIFGKRFAWLAAIWSTDATLSHSNSSELTEEAAYFFNMIIPGEMETEEKEVLNN